MSAAPVPIGRTSAGRRLRNRVAIGLMIASIVVALVPLLLILFQLVRKGAGALSLDFLTQPAPFDQSRTGGGYWNGIKGTIKLLLMATALAVPVGLLAAVYLNEYGRGGFSSVVRFVANLMAGVPSIFIGIFVFALVVEGSGYAAWKGALALALLMLPIVVRGSEEVLRLVPRDLREASLALGAPRWRTVVSVVLPAASSGLTTAAMLAVARAAGETAPLLFTSFGNQFVTGFSDVGGPDSALPLLIFGDSGSAYDAAKQRAWAGALVLIAIVLVLTIVARVIATRGPSLKDRR